MVPGSMQTSTRLTATRLPNRFVTPVAARIVMSDTWGAGAHGRAPLSSGSTSRLPHLQRRRLPLTDGDEPPVLDLDQRPLLDRIAGVLAVEDVDDGNLAVRAGQSGEILDGGQRIAHFLAIRLERLRRVGDVGLLDGLRQHLHGVIT